MSAKSRNKGASYEREIAGQLFDLTGIKFARNLRQYQASGDDDLRADDPDWPFSIECKRYATARTCAAAWKQQATEAAQRAGKVPAVIWRGDRMETRVSVPLSAVHGGLPRGEWADITLSAFAALAREIMAGSAMAIVEHRGQVG